VSCTAVVSIHTATALQAVATEGGKQRGGGELAPAVVSIHTATALQAVATEGGKQRGGGLSWLAALWRCCIVKKSCCGGGSCEQLCIAAGCKACEVMYEEQEGRV
jgi:hypothetical protein